MGISLEKGKVTDSDTSLRVKGAEQGEEHGEFSELRERT